MRRSAVKRETKETQIKVELNIDGTGESKINTDIGFFGHMLETFARYGAFDIFMDIRGDLNVDQHHTVEDTGIVLGKAFKKALGDKKGIKRSGFFICPMDEALVMTAVDISNRSYFVSNVSFQNVKIGDFSVELLEDFFQAFVSNMGATIHVFLWYGRSDHHKIEAIFKSLGRSLREACEIENRLKDTILTTKGIL